MLELLEVKEENGKVIIDKERFEEFLVEFDSLMETMDILSDKEMMEQIRQSEDDIRHGRVKEIKSDGELRKVLVSA